MGHDAPISRSRGERVPGHRGRGLACRLTRGTPRLRQPSHPPHPPESRRIGEWVTVDEEEVAGPAFDDPPGVRFVQELTAANRRGGERLPGFQAGLHEGLDLPSEMIRSPGSAAEVRAGRDSHARSIREVYALDRPLPPTRDPLLPLLADKPR